MKGRIRSIKIWAAAAVAVVSLAACDNNTKSAESSVDAANTSSTVGKIVETRSGRISGFVAYEGGHAIHVFRGIPYAAPPVGELRWKAPQPAEPWADVRDATEFGPRCAQGESAMGETSVPPSEDCLHLNILTPAKTDSDRLPVMVFFHGGGLTSGTGNSPLYTHTALPARGIVLVTVNSRLGPMGYMAHPALSEESEHGVSGNYGTLDLIASLQWIQDNIEFFGGDPDNVLIFGESGGGTKTLSLIASPLAKGLFHKAIVESGAGSVSPDRVTTMADAEERGRKLADKLGSHNLAELRNMDWRDIIAAASSEDVAFRPGLAVDGRVLPESLYEMIKTGKHHAVPLIVGANAGERSELHVSVPRLANLWNEGGSEPVYVYNFSHVPTGWRNEPCVAFHGLELPYVFGYVPEGLAVPTLQFLKRGGGCQSEDPGADELDNVVAEQTMQLWANFAKTGIPSIEGLIEWPAYTKENDAYLDIGPELQVKQGIRDAYQAPPGREG